MLKDEKAEAELFATAPTQESRRNESWLSDRIKRGAKGVFAELHKITPALAEAMFRLNTRNRPLSEHRAKHYARLIKEGRWHVTGESIIVSKTGVLLNGQTRLRACIEVATPFDCLIVFGIDDDAFVAMDQGAKRQASDVFSICGEDHYTIKAAASMWLFRYKFNKMNALPSHLSPQPEELYEFYQKNKRLAESIPIAVKFNEFKLAAVSLMTCLHYICAQDNRALADEFFTKVATGVGFKNKNEPARALWKRLMDARDDVSKLPDLYKAAFTLIAWKKMRANQDAKLMRWTAAEAFPRV